MEYFLLKQDRRYTDVPRITNFFQIIDTQNITPLKADRIEDNISFFIKSSKDTVYLDILDVQTFLVSEITKRVMEKYNRNIIFKRTALIDRNNQKQKIYYIPIFEEFETLHKDSKFNWNKSGLEKIVLDKDKIKDKKIFKVKESSERVIVIRLDVAESLLRRKLKGISIERLEIK
ncbi:imm11 family protein [Clostridium butyricum]|uniref:Immunity MXAN-0049 protein domain-containing protein n=1 Tax=Clostridium butyricum TaxID=1492 RepID=A0A2S7FBN3_CLOBU|nr:DUF1629 domain-containing protein [Clostridium butyricum]KHD14116.1 hypothetical protein OA81_17345 [Clostridium butyricum]PPV15308.1 hypothetical protein AWN73_12460 [Clostridium butyricum]